MQQDYTKPLRILKASAGSGKTFRLTVRFLSLLFSGNSNYRKIMAVTFTNKATSEMKHRVLSVLEQLAKGANEETKPYLSEIQKQFPDLSEPQIQKQAQYIYRQILHDYGRLTITTIDKFVQQIIRSFTFELGIDADYRVTLNNNQVSEDLSERLHLSLNEKPELLTWIIERARAQINEGKHWNYQRELKVLSYQIFTEDFHHFETAIANANSDEIFDAILHKSQRIKMAFVEEIKTHVENAQKVMRQFNPPVETLKGKSKSPLLKLNDPFPVFFKSLQDNPGIKSFQKLTDNREAWFNKAKGSENPAFYSALHPVLQQLMDDYESGLENYILATEIYDNLYYLRLIKEMSSLLKDYRSEHRLLLISDATHLLEGVTRGMEDNPSFIWEKAGNRFLHFLFDEFQDTSRNQWKNFLPLVKNALAEASGKMTEQLIVGDVKQSIYRWRGGDWKILLKEAENELGPAFVTVQSLQINYRSAGRIIEFNNYVFPFIADWLQRRINYEVGEANNARLNDFWHSSGYDSILTEAYKDVCQELPKQKSKDEGIVDWKVFPVTKNNSRKKDSWDAIHTEIAETLFRWIITEKRYTSGQIGILVRTNTEAQSLLNFLKNDQKERGMPHAYDIISGEALKLNDHIAIQLILKTIQLLVSRGKDKKLYQSACAFLFNALKNGEQQLREQDWIKLGNNPLNALSDYLPESICKTPDALLQLPMVELTEAIVAAYGLNNQPTALPYLLSFRDCLTQFMEEGNNAPTAFLEWWDIQPEISLSASENPSAVQVMTIHKAKGLAFDVVMLPFMFWPFSAKPNSQVWSDLTQTPFAPINSAPLKYTKAMAQSSIKNQYFEEQVYCYIDALNMLYVALTRPRKHLFLCFPDFNEPKDKKSMVMGLPKSMLAGDILNTALKHYRKCNGKELLYPEPEQVGAPPPTENEEKTKQEQRNTYPIAHHLKKQMDTQNKSQLQRLDNDENIRVGLAVHELLSVCHSPNALEPELEKLYQEGWFSSSERKAIATTALRVLENNALQTLLSRPGTFLNEREIINEDGKLLRPDKVLVGKEETLIIDFKFTGKESDVHRQQVANYKNAFSKMGYPNVQGWLFYGFQGKLQEV